MEPTPQNFQVLTEKLKQTFSNSALERKEGEEFLKSNEHHKQFPELLLRLINAEAPEEIRVAGAVFFKRYLERNWSLTETEGLSPTAIHLDDRNFVKKTIVSLMLSSPTRIQSQLSAALQIICRHDFPAQWTELMPELVEKMSHGDYRVICGVLTTADSIFQRYRYESKTDDLWREIFYCIKQLGEPLTALLRLTLERMEATKNDKNALVPVVKAIGLLCSIYYSLCSQDLPEFFEDHLRQWLEGFQYILMFSSPVLVVEEDAEPSGTIEAAKAEVCRIVTLFSEKYNDVEAFLKWIPPFVKLTWELLTNLSLSKAYDDLVTAAMGFLTSVVTKPWHRELFKDEKVHQEICQKIIIPNIRLRESDVEEFEMNGLEYLRRDMEGSDANTRRRMAVDLVQGLCRYFEEQISKILFGYIETLIQEYSKNPDVNWFAKDAAIFLVLAIAVQEKTERRGAIRINQNVNVGEFLQKHVFPELTDEKNMNSRPILRADCIKFVLMFRSQLPDEMYFKMLQTISKFLGHSEFVVHTYAARAIEKMLSLKDENMKQFKVSAATLRPLLPELLSSLFKVLEFDESKENEYVMRAITRVCIQAKEGLVEHVSTILTKVNEIVNLVAKNPTQPTFNHYLFETISASIRSICESQPNLIAQFEDNLFPVFESILNMESCPEFPPYIFQLIGQMLRIRGGITQQYERLFPVLLTPALWSQAGNVRPLTNLLIAFMRNAGEVIVKTGKIEPLLGVFQKLLSQRTNDFHAFAIVQSVLEFLPAEVNAPFLPEIMRLIFTKLQKDRSQRFVKNFCIFCAYFIITQGFPSFLKTIDFVQDGILTMLVKRIWLPNVEFLDSDLGRRICVVGICDMLCSPEFITSKYMADLWGPLLQYVINIFELKPAPFTSEHEELEELERAGYNAQYSHLAYARDIEHDPVSKFGNVRHHLSKGLSAISSKYPGKFEGLIKSSLLPVQQQALSTYFQEAKVTLH
uniref:Exportin-2 n=1 Tax=Hirondellea gigas TaxID=1518452 RepID=A0A6A7G5K1_9CRUS